jgi:dienelactone hydrolase
MSLTAAILAASLASSSAAVLEEKVTYTVDGVEMEGFFARPRTRNIVPGVVIIHDWDGANDYEYSRTRQIAQEFGYAAFALDVYGKKTRPKTMAENAQFAGRFYADRPMFRRMLAAGADVLAKRGDVMKGKIAVMGYCFGGTGVLEMARAGYPMAGGASFHGGLSTTMPAAEGAVKSPLMVFHAAQDPFVPRTDMVGFLDEMQKAKADYQMVVYNLRAHAFTKPGGADYSESADKRSWKTLQQFLKDVFAKR